jgi:hypothetical protein
MPLAQWWVFTFQGTWNDFLGPLIYLHDQSLYTVTLGLNFFRATYTVNWAYLMAASLTTMLPVIIIFCCATGFHSRHHPDRAERLIASHTSTTSTIILTITVMNMSMNTGTSMRRKVSLVG